jgi:hypothetical protein
MSGRFDNVFRDFTGASRVAAEGEAASGQWDSTCWGGYWCLGES